MIQSSIRALGAVALIAAAVAGCRDKPPAPPDLAEVMPNLPLPPNARFLGHAGGEDALQITFVSTAAQEQVEAYYKSVFTGNGWRLVSRAKDAQGAFVLLAEQDGPPLWVRIEPTDSNGSTVVQLSGARLRNGDAPPQKPAS